MTKSRAELHLKGKQSFLFVSFFGLLFLLFSVQSTLPFGVHEDTNTY